LAVFVGHESESKSERERGERERRERKIERRGKRQERARSERQHVCQRHGEHARTSLTHTPTSTLQ